jgi:hypothetical protein
VTSALAAPPDAPPARRRADGFTLALSCVVLALAALLEVTPDRQGVALFGVRLPESCATRRLFGHPCPGCGLTRSFVLGVRGDAEAFRLHPLGPLLLALVVAQLPYRAARLARARRLARAGLVDLADGAPSRLRSGAGLVVLAALLVVWIIRLARGGS